MMFDPCDTPRVFVVPPGADFPKAIVDELVRRHDGTPPEALARVQIFVNAERMRRRLIECFTDGAPRLLPRISLVSDLVPLVPDANLPPPISPLDRQLEMARLLTPLLDSADALAPKSALLDLAESLIALLDEMHSENVTPEAILALDTEGAPRHWAHAQTFLGIVQQYLRVTETAGQDAAARQRTAARHLIAKWHGAPPNTPVLVVGSTGSRGTTFELMQAVARLPQGAVVLPGFDTDMPDDVWQTLADTKASPEDHAQYRYAAFFAAAGLSRGHVQAWPAEAPDPARNALISLSLRPAPVTDQWRRDGPDLGDLAHATRNMTLISAPQPRDEAQAVAVAIRRAIDDQQTVALITPDRTLGRRVTAALQRWSVTPDDSAGMPLSLSPPGRFLRQIAGMMGAPISAEALIALLRHPLARTGGDDRGQHALWVNELELALRKASHPVVTSDFVTNQGDSDESHASWCKWVASLINLIQRAGGASLAQFAQAHIALAETTARGADTSGAGELWDQDAGRAAHSALTGFLTSPHSDAPMTHPDYTRLLDHALAGENVRSTDVSRADVMIWGTLEARAQGADQVILGGLNEGIWPGDVRADPWLSRTMRRAVGLLSPERQVGLSAHDYQQAASARTVILSRARRNDEAETVPSRWLNRLTNLIGGLPDQKGQQSLDAMTARGDHLLAIAAQLDAPTGPPTPAKRPAPAPPPALRPKQLSVTTVEKLIRDPYWIYARHILRLRALKPLRPEPDAALRGTVFHKIVERFVDGIRIENASVTPEAFLAIARMTLDELVPWAATRRLWMGHLEAISDEFVANEATRQSWANTIALEVPGKMPLSGTDFVITGEADRIDRDASGQLFIYDYKAGTVPSAVQVKQFQPQVLLEAVMAEHGCFKNIKAKPVIEASYLSMARAGKITRIPMEETVITTRGKDNITLDFRTATTEKELANLLTAYMQSARGYLSRRAMEKVRFDGDFDHLARFGEWDETDTPEVILLP